tara:strand:- start:1362 stop:2000 length:639 start_codon:yes stop_codon:yes gene_type:complete
MHSENKRLNILFLGTQDFSNSLEEIKDFFDFKLTFKENDIDQSIIDKYNCVIIDDSIEKKESVLKHLNNTNVSKLAIVNKESEIKFRYDEKIFKPLSIIDLNKKIIDLNTKKKFFTNSSIKIKSYILDKNEKKLKKEKLFIIITEKEIQLLELLFNKKKPIQKKDILEKVWKYAPDADTHTVETHIYRLRKKIFDKFKDEKFILNKKDGYLI